MNLESSCSGSPSDKPDDGKYNRKDYIPLNLAKDRLGAYDKRCSDYFEKKRLNNPKRDYNVPSGLDDSFARNRIS